MSDATELIGLDWGTTSVRAYRLVDGAVVETRSPPAAVGVAALAGRPDREAAYQAALADLLAGWPDVPVVACGMIGSAQGWREVPYLDAPADLTASALVVPERLGDRTIHLVRGVSQADPPDVLRGEETQLLGLLNAGRACRDLSTTTLIGLPGTHTKWVRMRGPVLESFRTALTGELFALLTTHGLLGRTMAPDADPTAFPRGVEAAREAQAGPLLTLFGVRARGLLGQLSPAEQRGFLSGLLIGHEVLDAVPVGTDVVLTGSAALCAAYADAIEIVHGRRPLVVSDAAPRGLWRAAQAAGLL